MGNEWSTRDDEADDIGDHDDADDEVEIEKLWGSEEESIRAILRSKKTGEFPDVWYDVVTRSIEIHARCDTSDDKRTSLGIENVEKEAF